MFVGDLIRENVRMVRNVNSSTAVVSVANSDMARSIVEGLTIDSTRIIVIKNLNEGTIEMARIVNHQGEALSR